ncbi:hypothetical protein FACS1894139_03650 [Planctomycetales bacterium]|nr:hypothetical protein FACS1894108_04590 [Planctomycetales bacterium]GHT03421.1 hypothetical protein FACS1894139_03650 [Planctomycetales bacterium]
MFDLALGDRESFLRQLGCSRRLANRLVAWQTEKIATTLAVAENAAPASPLEQLLLAKPLLARASFRENFSALRENPAYQAAQASFDLALAEQDGWLIIATADETLIAAAPLAPVDNRAVSPAGGDANLASLDNHFLRPANGVLETLPALAVKVFTAATSDEKVSALGQLAFAPLPTAEKQRIFYQALGEPDGKLRAAAALGMKSFGVAAEVADTLAAFAAQTALPRHAERLRDLAVGEPAQTAALMLLAGCVRDPDFSPDELALTLRVIAAIGENSASPLLASPDFWRVLQERMLAADRPEIFRAVFAGLARRHAGLVARLVEDILRSNSADYRAQWLALMSAWTLAAATRAQLLPAAVATFMGVAPSDEKSFALRKFIADCGDDGVTALCAQLPAMTVGHQRAVIRFADNQLCRGASAAALTPLAEHCREWLTRAPLALRLDIVETRVAWREDLPAALRDELAQILLRDYADYAPLGEIFTSALARLNAPVPLLTALRRDKNGALGKICAAALRAVAVAHPEEGAEILRELVKLILAPPSTSAPLAPVPDALYLAIGQIAALPNLPPATNALTRRMLRRVLETCVQPAALQAAGQTFLGNFVDDGESADDARFLADLALRQLTAPASAMEMTANPPASAMANPPENSPTSAALAAEADDDEIFTLGAATDAYVEMLPAALSAARDLAIGYAPLRAGIVETLLKLAARSLTVRWGLANEAKLTDALGKIGAAPTLAPELREKIVVALSRRVKQPAALTALAEILALKTPSPRFDRLATALVKRLTAAIGGEKNAEMRENYLRILTTVLWRGSFAGKRVVEEVLTPAANLYVAAIRQGLNGAWQQWQTLRAARVFGDGELAARLERELSSAASGGQ